MKRNRVQPEVQPTVSKQSSIPSLSEKELDSRLRNGPLAERGCTDIICLLLLILSVAAMVYISIEAYDKGKPERLTAAYDADKKACGLDVVGFPYLYWALPYTGYFNRTTCVKECPIYTNEAAKPIALQCSTNPLVPSCASNCMDFNQMASQFPPDENDPAWNLKKFVCIFNSTVYFDKICMPSMFFELVKNQEDFKSILNMDALTGYVEDLEVTKYAIYASFGAAFILGLAYLFLTKLLAGILIWASIFLYFIGMGFGAYWCYTQEQFYTSVKSDTTGKYTYEQISKAGDNQLTFMYLTYVMYGIIGISLIGLACVFKKIQLAIAIIKTAAAFVKDQFLIVLVPPVTGIVVAGLWFWWIYTAVYVYSMGDIQGDGQTPFANVQMTDIQKQYLWYFIFGGLWKNAFLQAINNFIIASTVCIWYFSHNGVGANAERAITRSIYRAFRYHLGSLAFGSLILAIVQFIRLILEYVRLQVEKAGGNENKAVKCLLKCLSCIMACFERFIRFLTNNAYIMVALTGKSFCPAAKAAFESIWANSMRFALVNGIGGAFIVVGKFCISVTTVMVFYYIITTQTYFSDSLYSPVLPCIVVFIIAYCIAVLFMSVYGMACDAVLLCFIYDEELNKQNGGASAEHCPETLREFLEIPEMAPLK